jgi:hypothetical protein
LDINVPLPDSVVDATVGAYYPQAVAEPAAARARAQSGYTTAGAIAAALTAAGLLSGLGQQRMVVQITGYAALGAWLGCALLFLRAIATAAAPVGAGTSGSSDSAEAFVTEILRRSKAERDQVVARTTWAIRLAFAAVALTFAAIVLGFTIGEDNGGDVAGRVVLTSGGRSAVAAACGAAPDSIAAVMDEHALDKATVRLRLPSGCPGQRPATLLLPKAAVAGFIVDRAP